MNFVAERLGKWIQAAITLVIGILCIVAGAKLGSNDLSTIATAQDTLDAISMILGIVMIIVGSLSLVVAIFAVVVMKKGFAAVALPGALLLAVGISLVSLKYAYFFIELLLRVVPFLLIALGAVIFVDAIINLVKAIRAKKAKNVLVGVIVAIVVAVAAITLGFLCIGDEPVIKFGAQLIVFGIMVALAGALEFLFTFVKLPDTVIVVEKK